MPRRLSRVPGDDTTRMRAGEFGLPLPVAGSSWDPERFSLVGVYQFPERALEDLYDAKRLGGPTHRRPASSSRPRACDPAVGAGTPPHPGYAASHPPAPLEPPVL